MSQNSGVIVIFPIYGQWGAIQMLDSGCIICKTYIIINSNLLFTKTEKRTKKSQLSSQTVSLNKGSILSKKCRSFAKNVDIRKIRRPWYQKVYFMKLNMDVCLSTKFKVSSIILTVFRQDGDGELVLTKKKLLQNKHLKMPLRLGLR